MNSIEGRKKNADILKAELTLEHCNGNNNDKQCGPISLLHYVAS